MKNALLNAIFGCGHRNTTFPLTAIRKPGSLATHSSANRTYVVCLDCGTELNYDWATMRVGKPMTARQKVALGAATEQHVTGEA